jgi:hypothetical protein
MASSQNTKGGVQPRDHFGVRVRDAMAGMAMGVTAGTISRWVTGDKPSTARMGKAVRAMG